MQEKKMPKAEQAPGMPEPDTPFQRKCRMTWAALIKAVYEADPLQCPNCGGTMKIVGFIEDDQPTVIEKILRHCGLWKEPRPPPVQETPKVAEPMLAYGFFDQTCI